MSARQMPLAQQRARARVLDALRLTRPLTPAEAAEADNLAARAYHREHRAWLAELKRRHAPQRIGKRA